MIAVLTIIVLFCCFSAPGIRGLCKKYIFRSCPYDDPDVDNVNTAISEIAPTVILLPNNRMIVVDHHVYAQLQATQWGIDLLELGENVIRHQNLPLTDSTPSILDSEVSTTSKGLSPTSLGYGPPAYEEIFGLKDVDLPPSYSTVSFILKNNIELSEKTVDLGNDSQSNSVVNDNENSV
ncbi:hypothetical protein ABEB36_002527 [Hypothenemus hampei]|uniref:Uncharacterized protein n=1 Tax=Hypothenemus hampei TaxID=57062 RepID=A0ABD1F630_HYPHA